MSIFKVWQPVLLALCLLCSGTSSLAAEQLPPLRGAGCKTEYFLIEDLARGYKRSQGRKVVPQKTGNKVAIKLLAAEKIDFAFTCKPHQTLVKKFKVPATIADHWVTEEIANDPIVVLVNRQNRQISLSLEQLRDIFSGRLTNWQQLGGEDLAIQVAYLGKNVESGVLTVFYDLVPGFRSLSQPLFLRPDAKKADGPKNLGAFVSQNKGAVTFMALNSYRRRYGSLVNINGVPPNRENILNGSYPLSVTYHLIYDQRQHKRLKGFFDYMASEEGKSITNQSFISRVNR